MIWFFLPHFQICFSIILGNNTCTRKFTYKTTVLWFYDSFQSRYIILDISYLDQRKKKLKICLSCKSHVRTSMHIFSEIGHSKVLISAFKIVLRYIFLLPACIFVFVVISRDWFSWYLIKILIRLWSYGCWIYINCICNHSAYHH